MTKWFESKIEKTENKSTDEEKKSAKDIVTLTADNYEKTTQKGTTFIIAGGTGCGRCINFKSVKNQLNEKYSDKATFADLTVPNDTSSDDYKLYKKLKSEAGITKQCGYPIIIKCVDGKVEGFYDYKQFSSFYTDIDKMSEWLNNKLDKAESSTEDKNCLDENLDECADGSCSAPSEQETTTGTKNKYIQSLTKQTEDAIEEAKNSMIIQVQAAKSIGELKNLLLDLSNTTFDINTQLALMDVINEIKRTDELSNAKATVLNKLRSI